MAIGKCEDDTDIEPGRVRIRFGDVEVYPQGADDALDRAQEHLRGDEVVLGVELGIGAGEFTVYGCDLTDGYIRINADYTT
jgi:glutamate N-acetyltransferase/amino-acid N-acetyltransferase